MIKRSKKELWARLLVYDFEALCQPSRFEVWRKQRNIFPPKYGPFTRLLVKCHGWTGEYATRLILEYRKFIYLRTINGLHCAPPKDIAKVWQTHRSYSDAYARFFREVLVQNFDDYEVTRPGDLELAFDSYKTEFNAFPSVDIWGRRKQVAQTVESRTQDMRSAVDASGYSDFDVPLFLLFNNLLMHDNYHDASAATSTQSEADFSGFNGGGSGGGGAERGFEAQDHSDHASIVPSHEIDSIQTSDADNADSYDCGDSGGGGGGD